MKAHIVYIITNSNRACLEVGCCTDITTCLQEFRSAASGFLSQGSPLNNIVYMEAFRDEEKAMAYQHTLRQYTRMQREKLIRLKNPNWLNLCYRPLSTLSARLPTRHEV